MLKEKCQHWNLYSVKIFLKNDEEIKSPDKRKLENLYYKKCSGNPADRREVKAAWISALQEGMKNTENS